uniref:Translocon-associated protein subunit beta n=1 Tax=Kalanchoe fedtschenkoi TaxID=63787 RepID=A0A7N0VBM9_KALFE
MANRFLQSLIFVALSLYSLSFASATSDEPFIVAHKKATLKRLKSGLERVIVSIDIYNQGSSTAYDVSLNDESWPQEAFSVVSGNTSTSWERLDAGSILSHSFELEAKVKGLFHGAPALITFRIPTKAAPLEAYSSPIFPLDILAEKTPEKKFDLVEVISKVWITSVCHYHHGSVYLSGRNSVEV